MKQKEAEILPAFFEPHSRKKILCKMNYPVTQTDDNEYYLHHLYDGTYNKVGCLFADYENAADFSDRNTIIYGHNMRNGSMFAAFNEYAEQSYFDTHKQMYLVTPEGGYVVELFAAFTAKSAESGSDTSSWRLEWKDDGAYSGWLETKDCRSYRTEVQLYKSLLSLKRSINRELIIMAQREALQALRCIIFNLEYRFYKAYGMEIEDKRTVFAECTYRLVPREDEPSVCLMHD